MESKKVFSPGLTKPMIQAAMKDVSFWLLLLANIFTMVIAIHERWSAVSIMTTYWAQSVIIGCVNVLRIMQLGSYSTEGFSMNGVAMKPSTKTKYFTAIFFAVHYGLFHVVYAVFLMVGSTMEGPQWGAGNGVQIFWINTLVFFCIHLISYFLHRRQDRSTPNIGAVMFAPYIRIIPMHISLIALIFLPFLTPVFLGLKTLVDCWAHIRLNAPESLVQEDMKVHS